MSDGKLKSREQIVREILAFRKGEHSMPRSWSVVAQHFGVSKPCVYRLVKEPEYNPGMENSKILGMEYHVEVPACTNCGEGHYVEFCTHEYDVKKVKRNGRPKRKPRPKMVSLGNLTPAEERAIMEVTPAVRRQAILDYIKKMEDTK